ncbi:hypothetical protein ACH5RR_003199 [Cinchona calisaya]|uniref:Tyrosine-specific transport protein n=1 Tax=Cinchona calisaya TaxID=153742 RepID=A0ABD3AUH8_9GENT
MNTLRCQCTTLTPIPVILNHSRKIHKRKTSLLDYPFQRFYLCIAYTYKNSIFVTETDYPYQKFAVALRCTKKDSCAISLSLENGCDACGLDKSHNLEKVHGENREKNFWGAVGLIVGTAVGPGMLGLPAATIKSGPVPSTFALIFSWLYVISSIILVAELSFAVMKEDSVAEVSFTSLARKTLGNNIGTFVALVYGSLSFSLLVACVSGIGGIVSQSFPWLNPIIANGLFPCMVGVVLLLFPFKAIDAANRFLCIMMLFSIIALVGIGSLVGRTNILISFSYASWEVSSVLPAIPVSVLTLGFHVITPFICQIAGNTVHEARKAILFGGTIPFLMVLSWNIIVLGLAGTNSASTTEDPISLLLSVNPSALSAVQVFAFSALATSLIGYAVSFPKQVADTLELIFGNSTSRQKKSQESQAFQNEVGKIGQITFTYGHDLGTAGKISYSGLNFYSASEVISASVWKLLRSFVMPIVLGLPVLIASLFPSAFSRALEYAGMYANCFLFGILPPVMTHIYQRQKKVRLTILPGGDVGLFLLFSIAVILAIWH